MPRRLALALLALWPLSGWSWNAAGHRLVAAVAWQRMAPATRDAAVALLAQHPDHDHWAGRARPGDDVGRIAFMESSTWPDDIRRDPRFHDEDEPPTPPLPGLPDTARHRRWHHVDRPVAGEPRRPLPADGIDRRIDMLAATLADPSAGPAARAYALPWVIHLVADLHQPLHVASRYDADGRGDEGGNLLPVRDPARRRRPETTLHAWWDDLPGPPWLRGDRLDRAASALAGGPADGGVAAWRDESFAIARDFAYSLPADADGVLRVDAGYGARAREIADSRIAAAGARLAALLDRVLGARAGRPRSPSPTVRENAPAAR